MKLKIAEIWSFASVLFHQLGNVYTECSTYISLNVSLMDDA